MELVHEKLIEIGKDLLGSDSIKMDERQLKIAGLIGYMGAVYAREKQIVCDAISIDLKKLKVFFANNDKKIIAKVKFTLEDINNPSSWFDKLTK